jgi:glucose-6-phosphate dehydrogenase assembly protein OpcA
MPVCRDMSLGAEELNSVGSCRIMARKELDCVMKSVARIRLVKTENPNACVTVNCKVCGNSNSAVIAYNSEYCV